MVFTDEAYLSDFSLTNFAFRAFRSLINLKHLSVQFPLGCKVTTQGLKSFLKCVSLHLSHLTNLKLSLTNFTNMNDKDLISLSRKISKLKCRLSDLDIDLAKSRITNYGLKFFAKNISRLTSLKKLKLDFSNCQKISLFGVQHLLFMVPAKLVQLEKLDLNFNRCKQIDDDDDAVIGSYQINQESNLLRLRLNFKGCNITHQRLSILTANIKNSLVHLKEFDADFSDCQRATFQTVHLLSVDMPRHIPSLEKLALNFNGCKEIVEADVIIDPFEASLRSQLKELRLHFEFCDGMGDKNLKTLGLSISASYNNLNNFSLTFERCKKITNQGLEALAISISSLTYLRQMNLAFPDCPGITNKSFEILRNTISSKLIYLEELKLDLSRLSTEIIEYETVEKFWTILPFNLRKLRKLDLNLSFSKIIHAKDNIMEAQANSQEFAHPANLKELQLNFSISSTVTDNFLRSVSGGIARCLPNLDKMNLNFSSCWSLTDEGVEIFKTELCKNLKNLQELTLSFEDSTKLTLRSAYILTSHIPVELHTLQKYTLSIGMRRMVVNPCPNEFEFARSDHPINLQELVLDISHPQVDDNLLEVLGTQVLKYFENLKHFKLGVTGNKKITDKGIEKFNEETLRYLAKLRELILDFNSCSAITKNCLTTLKSCTAELDNLNSLHIDVNNCTKIPKKDKQNLDLMFIHVSRVKIS